jgi:cell surface protein SprA
VTVSHAYRSTYSVSSFNTNLLYRSITSTDPAPAATDIYGNFIPQLQINTITVTEQFSPLFSIDMQWNNSLLTRFEYKKSRNLSMNFTNTQLTEVLSEEYVIGMGYTIKNVKFPIKFGKYTKRIVSDLKLQFDVAIRDNVTYIRKMIENIDQATAGQQLISFKFNADYVVSERINLRLFYDGSINNPKVSSSYPTENHAVGLSLRFTLAQ